MRLCTDSSKEDTFKPASKRNTAGPPTPNAGGKISLNLSTVTKRQQSSSRKKDSGRMSTRSKKSTRTEKSQSKAEPAMPPLPKSESLLKIEPKNYPKHIVSTSGKNAGLFANSKGSLSKKKEKGAPQVLAMSESEPLEKISHENIKVNNYFNSR